MIFITQSLTVDDEFWATICPECFATIYFHNTMSPYCPKCKEIVPPYYRLVDEDKDFAEEYRLVYHRTGEVY